ncbi:MAG TPA: hypothetical protein VEO01_00500 [Pseudonocardiaceae bacterium]|nr:hypothetical protein [Pseudonocardiaceae bacterium]
MEWDIRARFSDDLPVLVSWRVHVVAGLANPRFLVEIDAIAVV